MQRTIRLPAIVTVCWMLGLLISQASQAAEIGQEIAVSSHLQDGQEFTLSVQDLLAHGQRLFTATWTSQEGGGRPLSKGTGAPLSDPSDPLIFPRNFNRLSAMDANSCAGCHNAPFGVAGGAVATSSPVSSC